MISLVLYATLLLAAPDAPAPAAELADKVARLVRALDAAQLSERDDAERQLLEGGSEILPLLPEITERTPAEVATRVARIQQKLLRSRALAAAESTTVTLKGRDLSLEKVIEEFGRQTLNTLVDYREDFGESRGDVKLTLDLDKVPFWRALDEVLDQGKLTLYGFAGKRGGYIINRPENVLARKAQAFYGGPFRIEPVRFEAVRDLRNPTQQSLKLFMEVTWEPRLQPFAILQPLAQVSATDSSGKAVQVGGAGGEPEAAVREGVSAAELELPLSLPERQVESIKQLKGRIVALVPGPAESFRFSGLTVAAKNVPARRVEQRKASTIVVVDHVRRNNEAWEVAVRVKVDAPAAALESHRSWAFDNEAYFEDADQQRVTPGGIEQTLQSSEEFGVNYYFDLKESPQKLTFVYRTPIIVLEIPLDYELHDLKLP